MSFQNTVMTIALLMFIIIMIIVGILMNGAKKSVDFPPEIGDCPDYWELQSDGKCKNSKSLGEFSSCSLINFKDAQYRTKKLKCEKAKLCKVEWDGITNMGYC